MTGLAAAGGATATIDVTSELEDVDLRGPLPIMVTGTIDGAGAGRHDLALAVNGRIATTAQSFPWEGDERFSALVPPDAFRAGRNAVDVLLVPHSGAPTLLKSSELVGVDVSGMYTAPR